MTNDCYYLILLPKVVSRSKSLDTIFLLLERQGFSPVSPSDGFIHCFCLDMDNPEVRFSNKAEFQTFISERDGLVDVWKVVDREHELFDNVNVIIDFSESREYSCGGERYSYNDLGLSEIAIVVDSPIYRDFGDVVNEREIIANSVKSVFLDICSETNALFGYSVDENTVEHFVNDIFCIPYQLSRKNPPTFLCWLNYFSNQFWNETAAPKFQRISSPYKIEVLDNGVSVSFAEQPWEVDINVLRRIKDELR